MRRLTWLAISTFAIAIPAVPAGEFEQLAKLFVYDASAPLNVHIDARESVRGAEILTVSYDGARAPVSASIVLPSQAGRHPAVVFMNDSAHKRDQFLSEALALARTQPPAESLLIDAPPVRPLGWRRSFNPMLEDNDRDIHIQAVIDARRGIDLLAARADVDAGLIAYVGQSDAANWGAILSSIEPRLRALVLIAGLPNIAQSAAGEDPELADLRYAIGADRFAQYVSSLSVFDPLKYLGHSGGAAILFQFGNFDPYLSLARAGELVRVTRDPKQAIFYDAGHEVNDREALLDRDDFLATHLGIGRILVKSR